MSRNKKPDLSLIKLLILDVDGVLTDGTIVINADGSESKIFDVHDGHGIKMWSRAGFIVAIISGRQSHATDHRASQLGIEYVMQDQKEKLPAFEQLLDKTGMTAEQVVYAGDDLMDLPLVKRAGLGVAVANAVAELKDAADYVTDAPGGRGAVREVIEYILKNTGRWNELVERYMV
jgi:3-deoxy-D-manno-octulosonate 8-phosphate phosphatase (KDO 8-P phosphatase)